MIKVELVNHHLKYAERMSQLSSDEKVKQALNLTDDTMFIERDKIIY